MGSIIKGQCKNCGYETKDLYYGAGFANFTTCCDYPVLDRSDKEVRVANIMEKERVFKQNPNLVFYDDTSLCDKKIQNKENFHEWGEFRVYFEGYFCPKCNHYTLGFDMRGCWD